MKLSLSDSLLALLFPLVLLIVSIGGCYLDLYLLTHNWIDQPYLDTARDAGSHFHTPI